jgi:competence protein ComEA
MFFCYFCPIYQILYMNFNPFKDWFYYSKGQRRGISVLLLLILITPAFSGVLKRIYVPEPLNLEAFLADVELLQLRIKQAEESSTASNKGFRTNKAADRQSSRPRPMLKPFPFDPNKLTPEGWDSLGMPKHISRSIRNFLAAGGVFRYKEDFQKIYLLDDWMYDELEAFIDLPAKAQRKSSPNNSSSGTKSHNDSEYRALATSDPNTGSRLKPQTKQTDIIHIAEPLLVNINKADTSELQLIRGIGPAFSKRIIGYRELLGGYINTEQLMEVYGLDSTRYHAISEFVTTDTLHIKKINLNTADYAELIRHPYINRQTANAILKFRDQHGPYSEINELSKSYLIDDKTIGRIKPYLSTDDP